MERTMSDPQQASFDGWAEEVLLAYLAGLFDGEGCVMIAKKKTRGVSPSFGLNVSLSNTDGRVTQLLKQRFGGYVKYAPDRRPNHRACYFWCLSGARMGAAFLQSIRPYTVIKSEQIDLALRFARGVSWGPGRLTASQIDEREAYQRSA
jgi:hypothetical protein